MAMRFDYGLEIWRPKVGVELLRSRGFGLGQPRWSPSIETHRDWSRIIDPN